MERAGSEGQDFPPVTTSSPFHQPIVHTPPLGRQWLRLHIPGGGGRGRETLHYAPLSMALDP